MGFAPILVVWIGSQVIQLLMVQRIQLYANDPNVESNSMDRTDTTENKTHCNINSFPSNYVFFKKFFPICGCLESQMASHKLLTYNRSSSNGVDVEAGKSTPIMEK